jgi:hypothetical protein
MEKEPYYCVSCGHKGMHEGIICVTTPCEKCESLLIVPLNSVFVLNLEDLQELADLLEDTKPKSRHLTLVKDEE